jgi:amino acid permease
MKSIIIFFNSGQMNRYDALINFIAIKFVYVFKKGNSSYLKNRFKYVYTKKTTSIEELIYLKDVQLYPNLIAELINILNANFNVAKITYLRNDNLGGE